MAVKEIKDMAVSVLTRHKNQSRETGVLENDILIPCIVGDIKSDEHTDEETHAFTKNTMCASEFIIDPEISPAKDTGNISLVYPEWNAKVQKIRVYWKNYF